MSTHSPLSPVFLMVESCGFGLKLGSDVYSIEQDLCFYLIRVILLLKEPTVRPAPSLVLILDPVCSVAVPQLAFDLVFHVQ